MSVLLFLSDLGYKMDQFRSLSQNKQSCGLKSPRCVTFGATLSILGINLSSMSTIIKVYLKALFNVFKVIQAFHWVI